MKLVCAVAFGLLGYHLQRADAAPPTVSASNETQTSPDKNASRRGSQPPLSWHHRGIALGLFDEEPDFDYRPFLREIAATGARYVSVVVPYYQHSIHSVTIGPGPRLTPPDATLRRVIRQARAVGLEVTVFPILRLAYAVTLDEWRGTIAPKDPRRWWASYTRFIEHFAHIAAEEHAAALCVGSELTTMEGEARPWTELVKRVRRIYRGTLMYSSNWLGFERAALWHLVDVAGISAYFWLVRAQEVPPTEERLAHAWREYRSQIARWYARVGKPVVFTELGYHSVSDTAAHPWEESTRGKLDLAAQQHAIEAFMRVWADAPYVEGVYIWNWFGWGGPSSREFTPRGKPAAAVICRWFGAAAGRCPHAYGMP